MGTVDAARAFFPTCSRARSLPGWNCPRFVDRVVDEDELIDLKIAGDTGDESSVNLAVQLSTNSAYQGYQLDDPDRLSAGSKTSPKG